MGIKSTANTMLCFESVYDMMIIQLYDIRSVIMEAEQYLKQEYQNQNKKVVYCNLGLKQVIVPVAYNGDKQRFVADIFQADLENKKYQKYNTECSDDTQKVQKKLFKCGEAEFLVPLDIAKNKYDNQVAAEKSIKRALRYYTSCIEKTIQANQENSELNVGCNMSAEYVADLDKQHQKYCANAVLTKFGKNAKFTAEQIAQMTAGAVGILPVVAYKLLDKKYHFARSKAKNFMDEKVIPYICKGALKSLIPLSMVGAVKVAPKLQEAFNNVKKEISSQPKELYDFDKKYKISDDESFKKLYEESLNFMALSMFPTEILVNQPYSDNKNSKKANTIGLGSYYYPPDGNPKCVKEWITLQDYLQKHPKEKLYIDGQKAVELMDGWFRYREHGRVYRALRNRLMGTTLTMNQFVAIATVLYNRESSGWELCTSVKNNYKNPIKCAADLMNLKVPEDNEDGLKRRHMHEALIYLNVDDYCNRVPYLFVEQVGDNYNTSINQQKISDCDSLARDLSNGKLDMAEFLSKKIRTFQRGQQVFEITDANGVGYLCEKADRSVEFLDVYNQLPYMRDYRKALECYDNQDYEKAIPCFEMVVKLGLDNADVHNCMARSYYETGEYDKSIAECKKVLQTGERKVYHIANYTAGQAYEKKNNKSRALTNYKRALELEPENTTYKKAVNRLSGDKQISLNVRKQAKSR